VTAATLGRIGPNATTRVAQALPPRAGSSATAELFEGAGLLHHPRQPPQQMVDEADVRALHREMQRTLGPKAARDVASDAGRATADDLLAHRIPKPAQRLLQWLHAPLAARVLLAAVRRNAQAFAGSGEYSAGVAAGLARLAVLRIHHNPLCQDLQSQLPACDFHDARCFERLFRVRVHPCAPVRTRAHPSARVHTLACEACGVAECRFEVRW